MPVSHLAHLHGIQPGLLFKWQKQYQKVSLTAVAAGEEVVSAFELAAVMEQISALWRLPGRKTMEHEIIREAKRLVKMMVKMMKEDGIAFMPKPDGQTVFANPVAAFSHYNEKYPHSAPGYPATCRTPPKISSASVQHAGISFSGRIALRYKGCLGMAGQDQLNCY